jgi:hypothetical protein
MYLVETRTKSYCSLGQKISFFRKSSVEKVCFWTSFIFEILMKNGGFGGGSQISEYRGFVLYLGILLEGSLYHENVLETRLRFS